MAEIKAGALPALPTGLSLADPDEKAKYNESIQKVLSALEGRQSIPWFKMAAAFADPGRTGSAAEGFGRGMGVLGQHQAEQQARELPVAQMRAQLAGQQLQMSKEEQAFKLAANQLGFGSPQQLQQSLMSGDGTFGIGNRFTPDLYFMISKLDPKLAETIKNAAGMDTERMKAMIEAAKMNMSIAQMYDTFGKNVTDKFIQLQGGKLPGQSAPSAGQTTAPPTSQTTAPSAKPPVMTTAAGDVPVGADGVPTTAIRDSNGNIVDIGVTEDPKSNTVNINGVEVTRPAQGAGTGTSTVAPEYGAISLGNNRFKLTPSGRIVTVNPNDPPKEQRDFITAEINVDRELFKKREESDIEAQASGRSKRGEPFQKKFDTLAGYDFNTVKANEVKNRELIQLVRDHPKVVGQLVHQGPVFALLQAAESGISTPIGSLSVPVTEALNKLNLSAEEQAVGRNVMQLMSELNQSIMRAGKDIYGPQISAFDAQEMAKPGFRTTDPASFITYLASKNLITNAYLGELAEAQARYFELNKNASTSSFFSSKNKDYVDIVNRLDATMRDLTNNSPFRKK
jgi:hypothetical protein